MFKMCLRRPFRGSRETGHPSGLRRHLREVGAQVIIPRGVHQSADPTQCPSAVYTQVLKEN